MSRAIPDGNGIKRHLSGWKRDRPRFGDSVMSAPAAPQPISADLYPLAHSIPVYDQESIGSCAANMGCFKFLYLEAHAGRALPELSRMSLYKFVREVEGTPLSEDSGAEIRDIMVALSTFGVAPERFDPYVDDGKQFTLPPTTEELVEAAKHKASFYYRLVDLFTIRASILQGFPVGFGFTVYESMMSAEAAKTGLIPFPTSKDQAQGGHAVVCVGYDSSKVIAGETGAIRCRNSWGDKWGIGGDFWLPYAYVTAGLATDFWSLRRVAL